jgi:prohibitin 2
MPKDEDAERKVTRSIIKWSIIGVIAIFVVMILLSSVRTVDAGYVGIKTEWGEATETFQPGLHFVVPIRDDVKLMNTQTARVDANASAASSDLQTVSTDVVVNYHISTNPDTQLQLFNNFRGSYEDTVIIPAVQEAIKANTAKYQAAELITKREAVRSGIESLLEVRLQPYGITVSGVSITNLDFSAQFNAAIEAKVTADQNRLKSQVELEQKQIDVQKQIAEANATAESQILQAWGDATSQVIRAEANANATLINAEANARAIELSRLQISPEYIDYIYAQRWAKWDGKMPVIVGNTGTILDARGIPILDNPNSDIVNVTDGN